MVILFVYEESLSSSSIYCLLCYPKFVVNLFSSLLKYHHNSQVFQIFHCFYIVFKVQATTNDPLDLPTSRRVPGRKAA